MLLEMSLNLPENLVIYFLLSAHINLDVNALSSLHEDIHFQDQAPVTAERQAVSLIKTGGRIEKKNYPLE